MTETRILNIHLDPGMLHQARSGHFNFMTRIIAAVESRRWKVELLPETEEAPPAGTYALHHMTGPRHKRVKIFRRTYYYPYWHIEPEGTRWNWKVAKTEFRPNHVNQQEAQKFIHQLRQRIMPGVSPTPPEHVLIPLQRHLTRARSFQTMSPVAMIDAIARTGKRCIATLHPNGHYTDEELEALDGLMRDHPNFSIGDQPSVAYLPGAEFVATQNSAVAMDAYMLARPVILFAQIDFHHIALKVADMGVEQAIDYASAHKAHYAKYLYWFLREQAINAMAPIAELRILDALKKGGWPI
ncbi:MAG: hypothetical protein ACK5LJ_01885 [Paracoccus sp. (in: a-proteobacteria)]